jgi:hypothetical protein
MHRIKSKFEDEYLRMEEELEKSKESKGTEVGNSKKSK